MMNNRNIAKDCPMADRDSPYRVKTEDAMEKIDIIHNTITKISNHTENLNKLEAIADTLENMNANLIGAATGKDHRKFVLYLMAPCFLMILMLLAFITKSDLVAIVKALMN